VLTILNRHGLNNTEAEYRLRLFGPNKVKGAEGLSMWEIFLRQVSNSLTLVGLYPSPLGESYEKSCALRQHGPSTRLAR